MKQKSGSMIVKKSNQFLIDLFFLGKEIFNVKWVLDYIKYESIYWRSWAPLILTVISTTFKQSNKFFKNTQKISGYHRSQGVIGLDVFMKKLNSSLYRLESL